MSRLIGLLAVGAFVAFAALAAPAGAQTPLFSENSEIRFTIEGPLRDLERNAAESTDAYPATVTLQGAGGAPQSFAIEMSPRGISRRTLGICDFPPLRLDFDKSALDGTLFDGQNRIKLVTFCKRSQRYERYVVLEYLAYRLYNEITPLSFRVRAAEVTYRDTSGREETHFGFLIEDQDDLAERNGLVALRVASNEVKASQLDPAAATRYALFQHMIGGLDWDMTYGPAGDDCCHNSKLLAAADPAPASGVVPAPYDFDFSGLVNAPYAAPPEQIPVRSVRTRYFRGYCIHTDQVAAVAAEFQARRAAMLALIDDEPRLDDGARRSARRFLEGFFDTLDNPRRFDRQIVRHCKG